MLSYIVGLIIIILTITGLNFYALKAYGLEGYQSRYFFPFTFIGALVTLLSIFKIVLKSAIFIKINSLRK